MALMRYSRKINTWDPLADLLNFTDVFGGRMLELPRVFSGDGELPTAWHPPVDMYEDDEHVYVKMDLPGLSKDDIDISFDGHILSITGSRKEREFEGGGNYWSKERFTGDFHRYIHVPMEVTSEDLSATFKDGVLEVSLSKAEKNRVKKIPIASGEASK